MMNETKSDSAKLSVLVVPGSSREQIVGWHDGALKVKLQAPPEGGKANQALVELLAKSLDWPKRQIAVTHGEASRLKTLSFEGLAPEELDARIRAAGVAPA